MFTRTQRSAVLGSIAILAVSGGIVAIAYFAHRAPSELVSRLWMERAVAIASEARLSPPEAARLYAYVATSYSLALEATGSSRQASEATRRVLIALRPSDSRSTDSFYTALVHGRAPSIDDDALAIVRALENRIKTDGGTAVWVGYAPEDTELWTSNQPASVPHAGSWKRWVVASDALNVPKLATRPSTSTDPEITDIKTTISEIDGVRRSTIAAWAGSASNGGIAALWQDVLFEVTRERNISDKQYALAQRHLAQVTADATMEAWEAKYVAWNRRPTMIDPSIKPLLMNPPYPSYVSERAAVSMASAALITELFPNTSEQIDALADDASNVGYWSGTEFKADIEQGARLGERLASLAIDSLGL